jgi:hypothetical protein
MHRSRNCYTKTLNPTTSAADDMRPRWRFSTASGGFKRANSLAVVRSVVRAPNSPEMGDRDGMETTTVAVIWRIKEVNDTQKITSPASSMPRF